MDDSEDQRDQSQRAFFGRRKGHPLRRGRRRCSTRCCRASRSICQRTAPHDLRSLFPNAPDTRAPGDRLRRRRASAARGQATIRDCGFIGSEAFVNGVAKALAAIDAPARQCAAVFRRRQRIARLAAGDALARIDLLYPDPWPKRRHWKRRFIQDDSLHRLARVLRPRREFRFATDIADYADYALPRVLRSNEFAWTAERADDWRRPWPDFAGTRYEAKALREGRDARYFCVSEEV